MTPVNFSVMSRSELVTRLERIQAVLCMAADAIGEKTAPDDSPCFDPLTYASDRGYLTGLCHALDVIQDAKTDSNYQHRSRMLKPKDETACPEPTFV
jgi:hypothetical protein